MQKFAVWNLLYFANDYMQLNAPAFCCMYDVTHKPICRQMLHNALRHIPHYKNKFLLNFSRQCSYNVTLGRVLAVILDVRMQEILNIIFVYASA